MVVKTDNPVGRVLTTKIVLDAEPAQALGFVQGPDRRATADELLADKRREVDELASDLHREMTALVRLLLEKGAWCEAVRLVVGVGGFRPAELADALSVMRSTVTRWYNCETKPQEAQIPIYARRLLAHMEGRRPIERIVDPKDLIEA